MATILAGKTGIRTTETHGQEIKKQQKAGGAEEKIPIATANEPGRSRPSIDASGKDLKTFLRIIKEKCTKLFAITEKSYIFDPEISTKNKAEQVKKE